MTAPSPVWTDDGIILYDGVCALCSGWVRFVATRDKVRRFRVTPIESPYGRALAIALGGFWWSVLPDPVPEHHGRVPIGNARCLRPADLFDKGLRRRRIAHLGA